MKEWFEDETLWRDLYPVMFRPSRFEAAAEEVDQVLALAGLEAGAVLDLCCGPGRHAVALAKRGFSVTGVDCTRFLLQKAKKQAASEKVDVEWVEEDMRSFVREEAFDLAINMFTAFGYFENKDEDVVVLRNIWRSLKPRGALLIEMVAKEHLARVFSPTTSSEYEDGTLLVQRHEVVDDWTRIRNQWLLIRDGRTREFRFEHTIYSGQEMRDRLNLAGFGEVALYGSLAGTAYDREATRLIVLARKG